MEYRHLLSLPIIALLLLPSCVAKKKYVSVSDHVQRLQSDSLRFQEQLAGQRANISALEGTVAERDTELKGVREQLADREALLARKESELVDKAMRMDDLTRKLDAQTAALTGLRKKVADALVNFKSDELTVTTKDGKVYVSLSEKLLFKSGSAEVDPKGKEAIGQLAQVLNANADIGVLVEGHTDTIPIASGRFKDNWELSTARATSIVRILTVDHKLEPKRVTAAGRGEWIPVASNSDAEGRARNRRTEIILTPDLSELFDIIGGP
jgi:chemotaxis protein MotB